MFVNESTHSRTLRANIRAELARRGIAVAALAAPLGLSYKTILGRMSGETAFTTDELAIIAEFLRLPVWDLWPSDTQVVSA